MRILVSLFLAFFVFRATGQAAEYHPSLPAIGSLDGLGVNIHFTDPQPGELEMIKAAGFKWVRTDFAWAGTEREAGKYDFAAYDGLVAALQKNGLHAVFILDYANPLYDDGLAPHTDAGRAAFAKWAAAAVSHFKGRGFLWEMWNEPNLAEFWKPQPDVQQYIALAKAVGMEIRNPKSEIRNEAFIGPACSTIDLFFLEECMKAGLLEFFDGVSVHPYRQSEPETVEEEYRSVRLLVRKYAPAGKTIPVLSGEWGYSTGWKDYDEDQQAKYLARQFLTSIANDVPLSIWYDWRDDGDDAKEPEHHFGIVRREYRAGQKEAFEPKPAYRAAKTLTTQLAGMRFSKNISPHWRPHDNPVLLFANGAESRLATWCVGHRDERLEIPASPGKFTNTSVSGGETKVVVAQDTDLALALTDAVALLRPVQPNPLLQAAAAWKRLPLEVVAHAPARVILADEFKNPSGKAANLAGWTNPEIVAMLPRMLAESRLTPEQRSKEMLEFAKQSEVKIEARASISREFRIEVLRATPDTSLSRWFQVRVGERLATFVQHTEVRPTNPLQVEFFAPGDDFLPVLVKNESGEAFSATCSYFADEGDYTNDCGKGDVSFSEGETEKIVHLHPVKQFESWRGNRLIIGEIAIFYAPSVWEPPFPSADEYRVLADGDTGVAAGHELSSAEPPEGRCPSGTPSVRLRYVFKAGWGFIRVMSLADLPTQSGSKGCSVTDAQSVGIWIWGDGRGAVPRVRFRDKAGKTFQASGEPIRHRGWKFVTIPLRPFSELPHWGGDGQGGVAFPVKWDTIFLLDNISREPVEGEVYFSVPTVID